jgi:hypothetical protein
MAGHLYFLINFFKKISNEIKAGEGVVVSDSESKI